MMELFPSVLIHFPSLVELNLVQNPILWILSELPYSSASQVTLFPDFFYLNWDATPKTESLTQSYDKIKVMNTPLSKSKFIKYMASATFYWY